ncbi:MAG: dTDP-4-dehydrorhamnose 3,5-epimerase [Hymenobacteraceae bacterium]|nr:dTDP-4-dehydrorhamnose 3,5-epimerase [Hymenobacteraceae bacterium]
MPSDTLIQGLFEFTPRRFADARGYFAETYSARALAAAGITDVFVQDNQSVSARGVLRGLHFQKAPHPQAKLVRVVTGRALDIAVDLRAGSPTFGQHHAVVLDAAIGNTFYIPVGFAHGFLSLEDGTTLHYKCTDYYHPETEGALRWNDPSLGIDWGGLVEPLVSEKDAAAPLLRDFVTPF